jgi:hypothetical protein
MGGSELRLEVVVFAFAARQFVTATAESAGAR